MKKYLSLSVGQLKFIDSFQFTPQRIDNLAKTLRDDEFRNLNDSCNHFGLIRHKGVYPYDYMDSFDRLNCHFKMDAFSSKLSGSPCSDSEYTHANRVWDAFRCKKMADYHDIFFSKIRSLWLDFSKVRPQGW